MKNKIDIVSCWCGSSDLENYSPEYVQCKSCGTLINTPRFDNGFFQVTDEEESYYGKKYWLEHQTEELGLKSVIERTRLDLSERCIYWLKCVLKYLSPNDRTLELGFGSGGLIALLDTLGYKSSGLELSNWLVHYVKDNYKIDVSQGSIEEYKGKSKSFDSIMLFDVMEHFPDPITTIKCVSEFITDEGYLFIQTPCFRNCDYSFEEMMSIDDPFIKMMIGQEHLYLYTESSLKTLLRKFGFKYFCMEQSIFQYDMFLVASKRPIVKKSKEQVEVELTGSREGRIILALFDLYEKQVETEEQAVLRLDSVQKLEDWLKESEEDRKKRLEVINELQRKLSESEEDRKKRLEVINELQRKLSESEENFSEQLKNIQTLEKYNLELIGKIGLLEEDLESTLKEKVGFQEMYRNLERTISKHWLGKIIFRDHIRK